MYNTGCGSTGSLVSDLRTSLLRATENMNSHQIAALLMYAQGMKEPCSTIDSCGQLLLSGREKEVLRLLASGYTRRDIGISLGITANTAARHVANIYKKLNISTVAEATRYAFANRIV